MRYGTQTKIKYLLPYTRYPLQVALKLPPEAERRLKWMDYIYGGKTVTQTARHFDIPEATVRYWFNRYDSYNPSSLQDKSRKPHRLRMSTLPLNTVQRVIDLRLEYKGWDKVKIQKLLKKEGLHVGQSRIQKIINSAGLKRIPAAKKKYYHRKNRRHMYAVPTEVLTQPGGLVYLDVKHLTLTPGVKVYQFTAIDHATRILRVKLFSKITSRCAKEFFSYLDEHFPFDRIKYLGSDNGSEFMGELDKELEKREIIHVFSSPRSPRQNPFVERVIRSVIDEVYYYRGTEASMEKQQNVLDNYVKIYNEVRPHYGLNLKTPMEEYYTLTSHLFP